MKMRAASCVGGLAETCSCFWQHGAVSAPERDPDEVARVLRAWFERVRGFGDVEISGVHIPGGTGFSNETILFDATWTDGGAEERHELVARVAPSSYQVFPDDTFALQFHVMRALADDRRAGRRRALVRVGRGVVRPSRSGS